MGKRIPLADRFWAKVAEDGDCLLWTGATDKRNGYGRINVDGVTAYAHRVAYELTFGEIPVGLQIDHLCRTRECVNPLHLEPVTPHVNTHRGETNATKTHCPQGHPYSGDNLRIVNAHDGPRRVCRTCANARVRDWQLRQRAAA